MDSPVFPMARKERSFRTWDELLKAAPPDAQHFPDKLVCVCEDQNIWPISNDLMPDVQDRQMQFKEFAQDAEQNAVASATRSAAGSALINAWSIASLMIFTVVAAIILMIALQSQLAQDLRGQVGVALPFLMGGLAFRRGKKEPKPKPERFKDWELVRVYDELSGSIWSCSMPLKVLSANLPLECRYTQELLSSRLMAMGFFGGAIFAVGFLMAMVGGLHIALTIMVPLLIALLGVAYGWLKGYQSFMLPPIWIVRRVFKHVQTESGGYVVDYDSLPEIIPEVHTKLNNMPLSMAVASRRAEVEEVIKQTTSKNGGSTATAVMTKQNLASAYTPRIWRAYVLYEMLRGRDIRAKMKGPGTKGDKLQKISMAGMALGSLGILVVAMLLLG